MRKRFYVFSIILFSCIMGAADNVLGQVLSFDHLTVEEGLAESTVLAVTQDAEGFMWFGTREGLNRYDARKMRIYRNDPQEPASLSDNFI